MAFCRKTSQNEIALSKQNDPGVPAVFNPNSVAINNHDFSDREKIPV